MKKNILFTFIVPFVALIQAQEKDINKMIFLAKLSARENTIFNYKLNNRNLQSNMFRELKENDTLYYNNKQILRISQVQNNLLNGKMLYFFTPAPKDL